jgi:hypothetical protein
MTLQPLDIDWLRGKRDLMLTLNGETFEVGMREGPYDQKVSGVMRTTQNGQVIEGMEFWDGQLEIAHNDVVVRSCYFRNKGFHTVYQLAGVSNALIDMCTFDGRPDNAVVNASNADFTFAHNQPMHVDRSVFLDASNDSVNFVGGSFRRSIIIGGGFTPAAHADAISVHFTVADFVAEKLYIDYRQRPGAVIPNACLKYVSHPDIGQSQGQPAPYGIRHTVACYDSILIGGGYTCYLDETYAEVENCIVDWSYWYPDSDQGDVYPGTPPSGFKNNQNCADVGADYVSIAVGDGETAPGGGTDPDPDTDDVQAQIDHLTAGLAATNESLKATNDRLELLIENLRTA